MFVGVSSFLLLLPDELKSCESEEELGCDSYLMGAHKQVINRLFICIFSLREINCARNPLSYRRLKAL